MCFNRLRVTCAFGYLAVLWLSLGCLLGCKDDVATQKSVFDAPAQRVEDDVLPELQDEAQLALQNLMNLLTALPELCAVRLASMGSFVSSLPALQRATQLVEDLPRLDNTTGSWTVTWRDVVLGDDDGNLSVDTDAAHVDITLTVSFRSVQGNFLLAVPFALSASPPFPTSGVPPSFTAGEAGFFLYQDAASGGWTLRWRASGESQVFEGMLVAGSGFTRVMRRLPDGDIITSLDVNTGQSEINFQETTLSTENKGITFFVRPGDPVRFRLRIGSTEDDLRTITQSQLHIGGQNQDTLPGQTVENFLLTSNLPFDPVGQPAFVNGENIGTFVWQDVTTNNCNTGEDQWRLRFSTARDLSLRFSGQITGVESGRNADTLVRITPVGDCQPVEGGGGNSQTYDCLQNGVAEQGYDICATTDGRLLFETAVNAVRDPGRVFIGASNAPPPSPDPGSLLIEIELEERDTSRGLRFFNSQVMIQGNNPDEGTLPLNPDQISGDPLCSNPPEQIQPRVRLTGSGDYDTSRFEGSQYTIDNVEFTTANVTALVGLAPFPDRGDVTLETRTDEGENVMFETPTQDIRQRSGVVQSVTDVELFVNQVRFVFRDRILRLTVE